ncbi:MAG TPA: hypothetical protein VD763_01835 [Candidatus Saccharimonadales bacterium]|nr:hypothetical protein [Candidatus Saccharimonadales bacterium]
MRGRMLTGALLAIVGLVWIGQGTGMLPGTGFMVGDGRWAIAGLVALAVGIALGLSAWRSRPADRP